MVAAQPGAAQQCLLHGGQGVFKAAVADHALAPLRYLPAKFAGGDGLLQRTGGKEQPTQVGGAARVVDRRRQLGAGEAVGQIGADGGTFGDQQVTVHQRRHLAHRVDGAIVRAFHLVAVVDPDGFIRHLQFFKHPVYEAAA